MVGESSEILAFHYLLTCAAAHIFNISCHKKPFVNVISTAEGGFLDLPQRRWWARGWHLLLLGQFEKIISVSLQCWYRHIALWRKNKIIPSLEQQLEQTKGAENGNWGSKKEICSNYWSMANVFDAGKIKQESTTSCQMHWNVNPVGQFIKK